MNKENCALKLVDEIILYYDARSKNIKKVVNVNPESIHKEIIIIFLITHKKTYNTKLTSN